MPDGEVKKRLITFLGTGKYATTCYQRNGGAGVETRYVAHAIAHLWGVEEVVVLATAQAQGTHRERLVESLRKDSRCDKVRIHFESIPEGRNEQELWEQFQVLLKVMRTGRELIMDITHGFRSQPFFAAGGLVYQRMLGALDDRQVTVLYGRYLELEKECSPIWDLTPFLDLLDWAYGAALLVTTGHAGPLIDIAQRTDKEIRRRIAQAGRHDFPPTCGLVGALKTFTDDLATVRTASLLTGYAQDERDKPKALGSAAVLLNTIESYADASAQLPALSPVLERMRAVAEGLPTDSLEGSDGQRAMSVLADRYLQFSRYLEAAVVLRESMVSKYATGPEGVEVNSPRYRQDERMAAEAAWNASDAKSRDVRGVRNDILHGGYKEQPLSANKLKQQIESLIHSFFKSS